MGVRFRWRSGEGKMVPTGSEGTGHRVPWRWLAVAGLIVLAGAGAIFGYARHGLDAAQADLQRQVDREVLALQAGQRESFLAALDSRYGPWLSYHCLYFQREAAWYAARPGVRVRVESVSLASDHAAVRVRLAEAGRPGEGSTWFFRRTGEGWRHGPPPPERWGAEVSFPAPHLAVAAQGPDREAAERLAAALEEFYVKMLRSYRLDPKAAGGTAAGSHTPARLAIRIFPYGASPADPDAVPSPQLAVELWSPEERAASLGRGARLVVARAVLKRLLPGGRPRPEDWWLLESLSLWHARAWQEEWRAEVQRNLAEDTLERLFDVHTCGPGPAALSWELRAVPADLEGAQPLAYTLGEFLGTRYPPERLRALLEAVGPAGSSWTAVQQVLGLSRQDLKSAWAEYLAAHYGAG